MRSIREIENLDGKKVLVRVDFNVPIKEGVVEDDFRIKKALPTIEFLIKKGAKVVLITHLGKDGTASLEPVIKRFWEVSGLSKDKVEFFENLRKNEGEEKNDPVFAKQLASLGDLYVNDAFPVSHRAHASVVGITKYLPSYAGLQLEEEVQNLSHAFENTKHPFLFILGGAKFSTKMPLIEKYLELADHVFVGGALSNDFLKASGYEVGQSLVDSSNYGIEKILNNEKLILPVDVVVKSSDKLINKKVNEVEKDENIIDIGSDTVASLAKVIEKAKFILWNGPLGKYEDGGDKSTKEILKLVAGSQAESVIGGGDTVALISELNLEKKFTFVSTGGGATLDFLSNGTLPGIKALE